MSKAKLSILDQMRQRVIDLDLTSEQQRVVLDLMMWTMHEVRNKIMGVAYILRKRADQAKDALDTIAANKLYMACAKVWTIENIITENYNVLHKGMS